MTVRRISLLILTIIIAIVLFLTVDIQDVVEQFRQLYTASPSLTRLAFIGTFIAVTLFGLPGAALLSVASGIIFGLFQGVVLVSIASGISSVLSFLLGRYLLKEFVENHFREIHARVDRGIAKEGRFYLFFLRVVPGIPFPVLNMIFGLSSMPLFPFWWITQIAMLPITTLLVNAGTGMTDLSSPSGVFTAKTIVSLIFIGIIPVVMKFIHFRLTGSKE